MFYQNIGTLVERGFIGMVYARGYANKHDFIWRIKLCHFATTATSCSVFSRIFQRKISANRLAMVSVAGGQAVSTIRLKFWLKFCFLTLLYYYQNPNIIKFNELMSTHKKKMLKKLCCFIVKIYDAVCTPNP